MEVGNRIVLLNSGFLICRMRRVLSGIGKELIKISIVLGFIIAAGNAGAMPFPVGEELIYGGTWNGIPVAWAKATVSNAEFNGKPVICLRVEIQTYAFFNAVFPVDDSYESLVDPETLLPVRYEKNLREGRYRCHEVTTFDFVTLKAHFERLTNGKMKVYDIQPTARDIVSFMYFMRGETLEPERETKHLVLADEKIYDLTIKTAEIEKISLPDYKQKIPSLRLMPEASLDDLFIRTGKATVWVSRDSRRLMTFAKASAPFGKIRLTLKEVNGAGDDFWIKEKKK
ncbi:MAG: DUF3108 domain-containing protein [Kiritimatiellales bacterium]